MKRSNEKFVYIETEKIKNIVPVYYNVKDPLCKVEGGDWDVRGIIPIENTIIYRSLKEMFIDNKAWKETDLYKYILDPIVSESGAYKWNCKTMEHLEMREQKLRTLHNSIKEKGILKYEDVKGKWDIENDEIMIAFDRNGYPLSVQNGNHRLALAKLLNIKTVPTKIYRRHEIWENTRKNIFDMCNNIWNKKSYQPIPHPDFDEIKPMWSEKRYELFRSNTTAKEGSTILDIGSLFGYICYRGELDKYICTACEIDQKYLTVMEKLKVSYDMKYDIIKKSFLDLEVVEYDVIFALNILHHFLKTENSFNKLKLFLNRCKFRELYIQCHDVNESQMTGAYKNFEPEEFAKFICEHTGKKQYLFVGEESLRKIYKIY